MVAKKKANESEPSVKQRLRIKIRAFDHKIVDQSVAFFSTKTLNSASRYCEDGAGGAISKITGTPSNPASGDPVYYKGRMDSIKQFNGFFLLWTGPQATCTDNKHDLEVQAIQAVSDGFKNVSLINQ